MRLHAHPVPVEGGEQGGPGGLAHGAGEPPARRFVLGQLVRLLVTQHLQPVLEDAQVAVSRLQLFDHLFAQQPPPPQQRQDFEQAGILQPPILPSPDQLEGLHDELDLAYATRSELHVVGELAPQVEEHVVREDAGDGQVARARVAHHELHAAHQRDVLGILRRESHLLSIKHDE